MNFEDAMIEELNAIPEVNGKVFPAVAPKLDASNNPVRAPYVMYSSSFGRQTSTLGGFEKGKRVPVELSLVANNYPEMKGIMNRIVPTITSFQFRTIGTDGPFIQEVTYEEPVELFEPAPKLYRSVLNFEVYFEG